MAKRLCSKKAAMADGEDRLSTLPEEVILLVLSFLPSRQAVRTSVLATRWRALWKSVPSIRVNAFDGSRQFGQDLRNFIHSLLHHRDPTPLYECNIIFDVDEYELEYTDEFHKDFEVWLSYAVSHKVRILKFGNWPGGLRLRLSAGTLISEHLTKLALCGVDFEDFPLDVLGCRSLQVLEMHECTLNIGTIIFPSSLQHLTITTTGFNHLDTRSLISAPGLVTLELEDYFCWTPLLKSLPSLITAFINTGIYCRDKCENSSNGDCGLESCAECYGIDDCVLLQGLSGATNLELITDKSMIFRNDIKWSRTFSKVKILLLGDWCMAANFIGLVYFLQHSPILQRLTLELGSLSKEFHIETSEIYKPTEQFLVLEHLKAVRINHVKGDKRIHQLFKVLAYHGVHLELINIEEKKYHSRRLCAGSEMLEASVLVLPARNRSIPLCLSPP